MANTDFIVEGRGVASNISSPFLTPSLPPVFKGCLVSGSIISLGTLNSIFLLPRKFNRLLTKARKKSLSV